MKTQKFFMAFAAIVALALSSCSQEEELLVSGNNHDYLNDPNAVQFGTYMGKAPQSRAGVIDNTSLQTKGFGVFAYYTETSDFATDGTNAVVPNFMCNQLVTWDKDAKFPDSETAGIWSYSPVKYWPNNVGEKVSFFAYAPYASADDVANAESDAAKAEYGITSLPGNTTTCDPKIGYTISPNPGDQLDLLYSGEKLDIIKENIDQKVQFDFYHAMTRIGFERVIEVDEVDKDDDGKHDNQGDASFNLAPGTTVTITKVSLSSTEFYKSGKLNLRTGMWDDLSKAPQTYTLTESDFTTDGKDATSSNSAAKTKLNNEDKYLMIFPTGETKIPVEITVEYNVTTVDPNLPNKQSQITSIITTPFEFAFSEGKYYNFVLRIGLTSVKLDVITNGWNTTWVNTDTEAVVNTPYNNTVSLIYDANGGKFANGSDQYIITSHVENWVNEDGKYEGHNPKDEAKFTVKTFQSSDITRSGFNCYFGGWTDEDIEDIKPESYPLTEKLTVYTGGEPIFVEKTPSTASRTIHALWLEPESFD